MLPIDRAANLAFFLLENTGSIFSTWRGKLTAKKQKSLLGRKIGRGTIIIDGTSETVANRVKVCFGQDYDDRAVTQWSEFQKTAL